MLLRATFNPAAIERKNGSDSITVAMFEPREQHSSNNNTEEESAAEKKTDYSYDEFYNSDTILIMTKFKVAITQNFSQVFTVEADDAEQAVNKISEVFENGVITINAPDLCETDFIVI